MSALEVTEVMAKEHLISAEDPVPETMTLEHYMSHVYRPDCEFLDGVSEERNSGLLPHSEVMGALCGIFGAREREWEIKGAIACRVEITPTRIRVPDVLMLRRDHRVDRIVRGAPLICMEVLSPDDTFGRLKAKVADYVSLGVENIWLFDPEMREVHRCDAGGFHKVTEGELTVAGTPIRVRIDEVFEGLD